LESKEIDVKLRRAKQCSYDKKGIMETETDVRIPSAGAEFVSLIITAK
jgi:hypothetical protein